MVNKELGKGAKQPALVEIYFSYIRRKVIELCEKTSLEEFTAGQSVLVIKGDG